MVVFENREGDDTLALTTEDIEERPVTGWWTRSRYVTVLSVAGCLVTSLAVVTTIAVYSTSATVYSTSATEDHQGELYIKVSK